MGVLRMIKRRLEAEMKTVGRDDLKLLAKLLQQNDLEVRTKYRKRTKIFRKRERNMERERVRKGMLRD